MKKIVSNNFNVILLTLFVGTVFSATAQKLPNKQKINLRAPDDVKIDGKATEWGNQLQAYNKNTDIFYSIANDDKNLYLIIQTNDHTIINKILGGGVTFTVNTSNKFSFKESSSITYPIINKHDRIWVNLAAKPEIIAGSAASVMQADSFMNVNNLRLNNHSKYIMVTGIKGIDTLVSIYNRDGIKATSQFDNKMVYTYELAIDLKILGFSINKPAKFAYNIKLSGVNVDNALSQNGIDVVRDETGKIISFSVNNSKKENTSLPPKVNQSEFNNPTDFWGEYTLAKK